MLKLKVLSSGSSGNCYLLENEKETLVLDCGIPIKKIKRGLGYDLKKIAGVICSHSHLDHAKAVKDFEGMGISVFKPYDETKVCPLKIRYGNFDIQAFKLPHNGTSNYGYYIKADGQRLLYMTDFEYCQYNFLNQKVNHILIECNYDKELTDRDLPQYEHKIKGHCSLDYCKKFIEDNKTSALRTVLLLHMGRDTLDCDVAVEEVKKVAGTGVYIDYAVAGKSWELSEFPF